MVYNLSCIRFPSNPISRNTVHSHGLLFTWPANEKKVRAKVIGLRFENRARIETGVTFRSLDELCTGDFRTVFIQSKFLFECLEISVEILNLLQLGISVSSFDLFFQNVE